MGEIGSGTGTSYPTALDTDTVSEVNSPDAGATTVRAETPNDLSAAVVAIETALGINPQGTSADVAARLLVTLNDDGTSKLLTQANVWTAAQSFPAVSIPDATLSGLDPAKLLAGAIAASATLTPAQIVAGAIPAGVTLAGAQITGSIPLSSFADFTNAATTPGDFRFSNGLTFAWATVAVSFSSGGSIAGSGSVALTRTFTTVLSVLATVAGPAGGNTFSDLTARVSGATATVDLIKVSIPVATFSVFVLVVGMT